MQAPSAIRGYMYPTSLTSKCPMYSRCLVTSKCQNYDRHRLQCGVCEQRVRPATMLGGVLPEGEFEGDAQLALKVIQKAVNAPFAHPDQQPGRVESVDMVDQRRMEASSEILRRWSEAQGVRMKTEDVYTTVDAETAHKLSDLKI